MWHALEQVTQSEVYVGNVMMLYQEIRVGSHFEIRQ